MGSRTEGILQSMIDGSPQPPHVPQSRVEYLLMQLGSGGMGGLSFQILGENDYNPLTGIPTISDPESNKFYLVPNESLGNDIYDEWIYVNNSWEKFGSGSLVSQSNWNESDTSSSTYIQNKPSIKAGTGADSIAEGIETAAGGNGAHAEGYGTTADGAIQHVFGKYNVLDSGDTASDIGTYVEIVGNGTGRTSRSNARTLDWNGNEWLAGSLTLGSTTLTEQQLISLLAIIQET